VLLPYLRAQAFLVLGQQAAALKELGNLTGYPVGVAELADTPGYRDIQTTQKNLLYQAATLPYTTAVTFDARHRYANATPFSELAFRDVVSGAFGRLALAGFEQRFFKLAQGNLMLSWADQLYRRDDPSSIRRARELYKGVLFLHGKDAEIAPHFPRTGSREDLRVPDMSLTPLAQAQENPAMLAQVSRARLALFQIGAGLNAYGYRDDMVPVLRYRSLKDSADVFAHSAKSAQTDFIEYMSRLEQLQIDTWQTEGLVLRAEASVTTAREQVSRNTVSVTKAQAALLNVQERIRAKQREIADSESFPSQFGDFFTGMKDALVGMVPLAMKVGDNDEPFSAATGSEVAGLFSKSFTGWSGAQGGLQSFGAAGAMTAGFGAFAYAGIMSMKAIEAASNRRAAEMTELRDAEQAAEEHIRLARRDLELSRMGVQVAEAELAIGRNLLRFQRERFLNADLFKSLALFANRLLARYLELGARTGWLAERALAFEQNGELHIIRLDYFPMNLRGVTGADQLQAHLAELEATRIQGVRLMAPLKHTLSLAREFPLAYGQLKATGSCRFFTSNEMLEALYPGTYGYRIRALTVAVQDGEGNPPRGMIGNLGISIVSSERAGVANLLARFPDALPLSEFRLEEDLFVYGLPNEALLQFEGSGFQTEWAIELPVGANPRGLRSLVDVVITFDMNASYSETRAVRPPAAPIRVVRALTLAASVWDPRGLATLRAALPTVEMTFDLGRVSLPLQERRRRITNLAFIAVGRTDQVYNATARTPQPGSQVSFTFERGIALSDAGPLRGRGPARPLNSLVGQRADRPVILTIDKTGVEQELAALFDVVLFLEYEAEL
jgi:hypothetical protein